MTREHDECIKKGKIKPFSRVKILLKGVVDER
jgi:hypothetical protein